MLEAANTFARKLSDEAAAVIVVSLGIAAFANSFFGVFLFDDTSNIVENAGIHSLQATWESTDEEIPVGLRRRPVGRWSFALNHAVSGVDTWSYHAVNLLIHLSSGLLLLAIVRRTVRLKDRDSAVRQDANWLACGIAVLWVVHPLQTESVTYIVQRLESLCGLFYLACLYCTLRGSQSGHSFRWYLLAMCACGAGMATKEVMITAPFVVLAFDRAFLATSWREIASRRAWLYCGLAICMGVLLYSASGSILRKAGGSVAAVNHTPSESQIEKSDLVQGDIPPRGEFLRTQPRVILHYIRLAFLPSGQCLDHRWPVASSTWGIIPPAIVLIAIIVFGLISLHYRPPLGFLILCFFVVLSPTSSFIPLRVAFEHRMYLPLSCLITLTVFGLYRFERFREFLPVGLAGIALVLVAVTHQRNTVYYSRIAMFTDNVMKAPHNPRAYLNLADALVEAEQYEAAQSVAEIAVELKPKDSTTWSSLGSILVKRGSYDEAIECLHRALLLDANNAAAHHRLAEALERTNNWSAAADHFTEAIRLAPSNFQVRNDFGAGLIAHGRLEEAEVQLRAAAQLNPRSSEVHNNLGIVLMVQYRPHQEAVEHFRQAVKLDPSSRDAQLNLERASRIGIDQSR